MYRYECKCGNAAVEAPNYEGEVFELKGCSCASCGDTRYQLKNQDKPKKWSFEIKGSEVMLWLGIFYCVYRLIITGDFDYAIVASFGITFHYIHKLSDKVEKLNKHLKNSKE